MTLEPPAPDPSAAAPDFALPDHDGRTTTLREFRGRAVVLFFIRAFGWLTCAAHARQLARDYTALADQGVAVLVIGPGDRQDAARYHARHHLPFPVLADDAGQVYARYGVGRWLLSLVRQSAVVVVDPAGRIADARIVDNPRQVLDRDALREALRVATSAADQPT